MSSVTFNLALTVMIVGAAGCVHAKDCEKLFAIERSGMGPIRLGMSESEVRKVSIEVHEEMREYEGIEFRILVADLDHETSSVEINTDEEGYAIVLRTYSSCFVYDEEYSVNSSFEELLSAFPDGAVITSESGYELSFMPSEDPIGFTFESKEAIDRCNQNLSECRRNLYDEIVDSVFVVRED